MDVIEHFLLSTDQQDNLFFWDLRNTGKGPLFKYNVPGCSSKVSFASVRQAIATSSTGLSLLNFEAEKIVEVPKFANGRPKEAYSDLRWNQDQSILFAGGEKHLDIYHFSPVAK